jgi:beta-N-acetylhexosaminidase
MHNWPLEAKVGQMMMFGFAGTKVPEQIRTFIHQYNLGGIIIFSRNVENPRQITQLNAGLQQLALGSLFGVGLFIAVDQEGGQVARISEGVSVAPAQMAMGALGSPALAGQIGKIVGEELAALGFSMNLAPCLDVNSNPHNPVIGVRSFGEDPEIVGELGSAVIRGLQESVIATAKHFPGHGDTAVDSHLGMPMISHSRERLREVELVPFQKAIAAGVDAILAAHVAFPALEPIPGRPSSLSYPVLTGLLREELGFDGLVLTDCMEMQAVTGHYPMGEAAVLAIEAGSDMVLVSHTPKLQEEAFRTVVEAVRSGRIAEKRIDQSLERIARAKEKYVKWPFPEGKVASDEHSRVMAEAYGDSMTVVRNGGLIPLPNRPVVVIETLPHAASLAEEGSPSGATLAQALADLGAEVAAYYITPEVTSEEYEKTTELVERCGLVIMVTQNAHRCARQAELARLVAERCPEHVFIGTRTPYELGDLPQVRNYLAAYSSRPEALRACAEVLLGKREAKGRLPVTLV